MDIPIDIVYSWCGEKSATVGNPIRHRDNSELRYSLRSVYKYAPWVNHIYILVNTKDMTRPSWLNEDSGKWITFVDRCKLFDNLENTPTYNSFAVHTVIHKIPGLTKHFIVMDDDMFFNNLVEPSYFFEKKTMKPIIRMPREPCKIYKTDISSNFPVYKYNNISHRPMPFRIDYIELFNKKYPTYYTFIQSHKYRFQLLSEYLLFIYCEYVYHLDLLRIKPCQYDFLQIEHNHNDNILPEFQYLYKILTQHHDIFVFNCNDDFSLEKDIYQQQLSVLKKFYERLYPDLPPFETGGNLFKKKIVIAGCAQDIQQYVHKVLQNIYNITPLFQEYKIIIFQNGSTDKTSEILSSYQKKDSNFIFLSEDKIPIPYHFHPSRIAYCRNKLIKEIERTCPSYDFMIMMDMDDVCATSLNLEVFKKSFTNPTWDGIFFNRDSYYDKWALRYPYFTKNCWNFSRRSDCINYITQLGKHLTQLLTKYDMLRVLSAFGGFGIYKMSKIKNCYYDGKNREKPQGRRARNLQDCEHVEFHRQMREKHGAQLFISSSKLF